MITTERKHLAIVTMLAFFFAFFSLITGLLGKLYDFFSAYTTLPVAEYLIKAVFLYLCGLTWFLYVRWRHSEVSRKELEDIISSVSPDVLIVIDIDGRILKCNDAMKRMFGYENKDVIGQKADLLYFDRRSSWGIGNEIHEKLEREGFHIGTATGKTKEGQTMPLEIIMGNLKTHSGAVLLLRDIAERKKAEETIFKLRESYLIMLDEIPMPIRRADIEGKCDYFNKAWLYFTGRSAEQEMGNGWTDGMHAEDVPQVTRIYNDALRAKRGFEVSYRIKRHDGQYRWMIESGRPYSGAEGVFSGYIASCYDITERIKQEKELSFMATHDPLTDLPNRMLFNDRLKQAINDAERQKKMVAVMFLDLDNFKVVNDTLGHEAGDLLLIAFAKRLNTCIRLGDTVARFGGDEFTIILPAISNEEYSAMIADRILGMFVKPFQINEAEFFITASIGITIFPNDDREVHNLLRNADMAMYKAKERGRNSYRFYTSDLNERMGKRLSLENSLRRAVERNEFIMYYQPQIDAISERIIGVEALLRWQHPHRGVLTPAEFIYLVEETGLIIPIGDKIIQEVCAQGKQWQFEGCPPLRMAFNIASTQFKKRDLAKKIMIAVNETGLDPKLLEVEITESTIMEQLEAIDTMLKELHDSGIQIAIDDFGTGYSSLGYLKRFHISTIKLGQIFIKDITINSDEALLASAIIVMAKTLNLNIVAEGVETREQLELLRSQGCPILQGYYFSKPLSADNMTELLLKQKQAYLNEGL